MGGKFPAQVTEKLFAAERAGYGLDSRRLGARAHDGPGRGDGCGDQDESEK